MEDLSQELESIYRSHKVKYEQFPSVLRLLRKMMNSLKSWSFHREYIRGLIPLMKSITIDNHRIINSQFDDYFNDFEPY
jgi:hypothetical protein